MNRIYNNILETIGNTPIIKLNNIAPPHVNLYAKVEAFNPGGSVKDRLALNVIEEAEKSGALKPGQTVIEATSGNTGIGLAVVCAQKGYPLVIVMAESFSVERRKLMRFLGAKVILTPASEKGTGMLAKAEELAEKHGWFLTRQFENEANADMHSRTTAPEILEAFEGKKLDYWVTGFGTAGTLKGVGRVLKAESPETKIAVCEPDNARILSSGIPQAKNADGTIAASHPNFRPHPVQGWVPDFIPKLAEDAMAQALVDEYHPIDGKDALRLSRELATREGIFVGISAGATLAGALAVAANAPEGSNILCMLPDTGERYLSTPLFEGIGEDMDEEEIEISRSTDNYRFDPPAPVEEKVEEDAPEEGDVCEDWAPVPAPAPAKPLVEVTPEAEVFVEATINDAEQPVVLFALEWCEFCWSIRKMFAELGIEYRSIDLDSVAYQRDDLGGKYRAALTARTGVATIPQIFVGGEFIGGCTEVFDAWNGGQLAAKLEACGVAFDKDKPLDAYGFLPKWLHARQAAE